MPIRRAMRWFSEFCGICLGVGLLWCHCRVANLEDRVEWLEIDPKTIVQNNNQQVNIIESPIEKLAREIGIKKGLLNGEKAISSETIGIGGGDRSTDDLPKHSEPMDGSGK